MHLDLHLHTACSDGALTPEELAYAAKRAGLHLIAITDHDTTAGVDRARAVAAGLGLTVLAGVELSCSLQGEDFHLLGYGIDPRHPILAGLTSSVSAARRERIREIVRLLQRLGVSVSVEDVRTGEACAAAGRPHVAEALVRLGVVRTPQEAFDRFLADGGPAHVPSGGPDVAEGIAAISAAGGVSAWAHPAPGDARRFPSLAEIGLRGVEALRPSLGPAESLAIEHAARAAGMVVSGGSDWHGGSRPALGSWYVTERHVGELLELLGVRVPG